MIMIRFLEKDFQLGTNFLDFLSSLFSIKVLLVQLSGDSKNILKWHRLPN